MNSPFPGMDPYLEGSLWTSVHSELTVEIARQLAPKLRPRYRAVTNRRFVMEGPEEVGVTTVPLFPDVAVIEAGLPASDQGTGIALAPLRIATVMPVLVPHFTVEIRNVAEHLLVTAIEVLSPTNKRGVGRDEYLAKRRRILSSTTHLLEIDLLREGRRVPMQRQLPAAPYFVFLSRFESRPVSEVWPIPLQASLPVVPIPLLSGDPDVALDLQLALTTVYDTFYYDLEIDYTKPPEIPLKPEDAAWADERLRAAGRRR